MRSKEGGVRREEGGVKGVMALFTPHSSLNHSSLQFKTPGEF
jgi:hypothetical protein